ncbi:hypothetical protein ACIBCM_26320 [Streptomyces sp. NPDC051018]|uniref:hypothetical protein n=1 Tax=Streptomyces sp. NPDC051018 TaxID=3365639 RepID=UPI0037A2EED5
MAVDEVAEKLARLCPQAEGDSLAEHAREYGAGEVLDRLTAAVRAGEGGPAVAADLHALDEAFARHGIDGLTTGARGYETPRGGREHPVVTVWACPAPRPCSRLVPRQDGERDGAGPPCALSGLRLVSRRIHL